MKFTIKHRLNASVIFEIETDSMRLAVEAAVKSGADLGGAYLRGAYLGGADLRGVKDVICAGLPREYWFHGWHKEGVLMIRGGCHDFTIEEARKYWSNKSDRQEIMLALDYIERIAIHLVNERGFTVSHAVATAVNTSKKWCATGEVHQWPGVQTINMGSRAEACAAVAQWEKMKASARAKRS